MSSRPNILLILSDDQGGWALGCAGNKEIRTPNLDRLASQGMMFSNFFCASPVCSPARASLFTGRIPSQHGVHDWLKDETKEQEDIEYMKGQRMFVDALYENGYTCGLSGKWHLGKTSEPQHGFTHWYCHKSGGGPYYGAPVYKDSQLIREERYITDAITDDALSFVEKQSRSDTPFFLYVGYTAPHGPWLNNHPKEYTALYEDCAFESVPHLPRHPDSIYLTDEALRDERAHLIGYYAAVTAMDAGIGRILQKLDEEGLTDSTIVVFGSDNGFSCGHHGFWGKGNGTFPINMYEESVKVPFCIRHPGHIPENTTCPALVSAYDFMPTLLDYLGVQEKHDDLPGASFAGILRGNDYAPREDVVVMDEYGPNRMIRTTQYKLIYRYPYGPHELYDLRADPHEMCNLIDDTAHVSVRQELIHRMQVWFSRYVNADIDGAKEAVFGSGQIGLAGLWSKGSPAHSCDEYIRQSPNYKGYAGR